MINNIFFLKLKVKVPVMTLCPCSLAISKNGAHNQRSKIEVEIIAEKDEWFEKLISLVENCGSSELFSVLRRPDEKDLVRIEAIINSMTKQERLNHIILNANRRKRIAKGSGTSVQEVNKLIKQYVQTKELMKRFAKGGLPKIGGRGLLPF